MDQKAIARLKKDLLKNKSHDIFKNVQALWDLAYSTNDMELNFTVRRICAEKSKKFKKDRPEHAEQYRQLYKKTLLMAAQVDFDSYLQCLEWNREPQKRFYLPRRKQLREALFLTPHFKMIHKFKTSALFNMLKYSGGKFY